MENGNLIKPILNYKYPKVDYAKGIYIYDTAGKQYIDGSSGAVTASIGHGVAEITKVMMEQASKVSFVYRSQFTNEPAEKLAEKLCQLAPGTMTGAFFVNSGSEATETAMKIAIQHWQEKGYDRKNKILSRWMSYHGITMGALSMSGHKLRRKRYIPLLEDFPVVSPPYCYKCPFDSKYPDCNMKCAKELETAIKRIGSENIAAFIAEPIIGAAGGAITPPPGYYQEIKDICSSHDILFIVDEVMTGIARTGKMFAMEHWGVDPDIICLGKGMSAGYTPMGAVLASKLVMEPIINGSNSIMAGHTYSANPLSAAISLAVLEYIEENKLIQLAAENGLYLIQKIEKLASKYSSIGDVRGKGMLIGLDFVANLETKIPFPMKAHVTSRVISKAFEKGLIIYPASGGLEGEGDAVIIAPPLVITKEEIDRLIEILDHTMVDVQKELKAEGWI